MQRLARTIMVGSFVLALGAGIAGCGDDDGDTDGAVTRDAPVSTTDGGTRDAPSSTTDARAVDGGSTQDGATGG